MKWYAFLVLLALIQVRFYEVSTKKLLRIAVYFWMGIYWQLWIVELIRRLFWKLDLEWWGGVIVAFTGFLSGELCHVLFENEGKVIQKKGQFFPSFLTLSSIYLMLSWMTIAPSSFSFDEIHIRLFCFSIISVLISICFSGISERLFLSDVPKQWQGFPILLISAAILVAVLGGIFGSF